MRCQQRRHKALYKGLLCEQNRLVVVQLGHTICDVRGTKQIEIVDGVGGPTRNINEKIN